MLPFLVKAQDPACVDIEGRDGERRRSGRHRLYHSWVWSPATPLSDWADPIPMGSHSAQLSQHYCTISLGGDQLGIVALLEGRGNMRGYLDMVSDVVAATHLQAGETVLEVGCGSGVSGPLAGGVDTESQCGHGVDINSYLCARSGPFGAEGWPWQTPLPFKKATPKLYPFLMTPSTSLFPRPSWKKSMPGK